MTFDSPTPETPTATVTRSRAITLDKLDNILKITDNENAMVTEIIGELEGKGKALNQYSKFNDLPLEYDKSGNLSAKGSRLFAYDYRNRLVRSSKGDDAVTFTYDIFGRQTSRTDLSGTQHFFYAGDQKIEERNASGQVTKHYLWGNGIDELLRLDIYNGSSSTPYYIHTDNIGSTTAITDGSGNLVERVTYDGYGLPTFTDALGQTLKKSTIRNTTLFQGREYDYDLALYNYRARYLDPSLGRFLQTDPLGYQDSMNLYQGMGMNPVNFVDPRGKEVVRAELGKHDVFATQRFKTGKWWLDLTIVGAFNELRNTAALTANMGANLLGIIGEAHDLVVESADKFGARIGISNSGNIQDFVQFSEIYFMANASQWSSAVSQLKGYLVPAMENSKTALLEKYGASPHSKQLVGLALTEDEIMKLALSNVKDTGVTVLGPYNPPEVRYITKALRKNASYFDLGSKWNDIIKAGGDPWKYNQALIIRKGDRVLLSIPKTGIRSRTFLKREIDYLLSNGYRWKNQWMLEKI